MHIITMTTTQLDVLGSARTGIIFIRTHEGAQPEGADQTVPVAVAPVKLKKDAKRAYFSGSDDGEPGSLQ